MEVSLAIHPIIFLVASKVLHFDMSWSIVVGVLM